MIDQIIFYDDKFSFQYEKESMVDFFQNKYPKTWYFYNHTYCVKWLSNGKEYKFSESKLKHHVNNDWNGITFIIDKKNILICNANASKRHEVEIPKDIIQLENYTNHISPELMQQIRLGENFEMEIERFDGFYEINNKKYLGVKISKLMKRVTLYGVSQIRYLDTDTGKFLPYAKKLSYYEPNQHAYNEYKISL